MQKVFNNKTKQMAVPFKRNGIFHHNIFRKGFLFESRVFKEKITNLHGCHAHEK